jgi:hypothetical protein
MLTAIVRFPLTPGTSLEEATALFESTAPRYRAIDGLKRKYYLYHEDGSAGGVYLWQSREQADAMYNDAWRQLIADKYGSAPEITYFETPVIVESELDDSGAAHAAE